MATQNLPYYVIVNDPSSTAADTAEVSGGSAILKDGAGNEVYRFKTSKGVSGETKLGLIESAKVGTFTVASVAADDVFSFIISQDVDEIGGDGLIQISVSYTGVSGDSVTDVAEALRDMINAHVQLKVTATNAAGVLTLTADEGYPLYSIDSPSNALGAYTETTGSSASPTANSTTNGLTTLTFASAPVVSAGDTVRASGFSANNNDFVVQARTATTVVIFATSAEAPGGTAGNIILLAQDKRFDSDDLIAEGIVASFQQSSGSPVALEAGETYLESTFHFMDRKGYGGFNHQTSEQEQVVKVYVKQTDADADHAIEGLQNVIDAI